MEIDIFWNASPLKLILGTIPDLGILKLEGKVKSV